MKLGWVLFKQNKGRMKMYNWQVHRHRPVIATKAIQILARYNIKPMNPEEVVPFLVEKTPEYLIAQEVEKPVPQRNAYQFTDDITLQEGLAQAQWLTNTQIISNSLPQYVSSAIEELSTDTHQLIKRNLANVTIFDAYQAKLPKRKDPQKPMWVFPRDYGIPLSRLMNNLCRSLLQGCVLNADNELILNRNITEKVPIFVCLDHTNKKLNLSTTIGQLVSSTQPLPLIQEPTMCPSGSLPDMYPLNHFIGMQQTISSKELITFPFNITKTSWPHLHTVIFYHDPHIVHNLTELPVTNHQLSGQFLMRCFTAAAGFARHKFKTVMQLPHPIVIQCVQTDGQQFMFGVFQLNTLELDQDKLRNYFWFTPQKSLYSKAGYESGRPVLYEYNPEIFDTLFALYTNK